ncbi:MAG TPA: SMC-Scp complex subunit ScpB [Rhodanobacteraceae bacterium]|nr:SMC-Scp complex subunit ScpB [Rhodanobacteraceae bacterium]
MADISQLKRIFEAALLGAGQPLTLAQLAALFDETEAPAHEESARALEELGNDCATRGIELVEVASGFRFQVREDVHSRVSRLWTERQTRYSRALLETLALIAYRQPITRGEIEQIRGVGVASSIIKTLEEREWVRVVGYRDLPGKPALLGTTKAFLDYFNLKSLDQLPPLSEIREIGDIDPELALAGESGVIPATLSDGGVPAAPDEPQENGHADDLPFSAETADALADSDPGDGTPEPSA